MRFWYLFRAIFICRHFAFAKIKKKEREKNSMQIIQYFDDRNSSKVYLNDSSTKNFVVVVVVFLVWRIYI